MTDADNEAQTPDAAARSIRFAQVAGWITAGAWFAFGGWLLVDPGGLTRAFELGDVPPVFLAELRAFYGGLELGVGLTLALLLGRRQFAAATLLGAVTLLCVAAGRTLGVLVDGSNAMQYTLGSFELLGGGTNLWAYLQLPASLRTAPADDAAR